MNEIVPICCLCLKVRDDKGVEFGAGSWVDMQTYAMGRQLPLNHGFLFSHTYCPDCLDHFEERMAEYRPANVFDSLRSAMTASAAK